MMSNLLFFLTFYFCFSKHAKRHPYFDPELLRQRWTSGSTGAATASTDRSEGSDSVLSP